MGRCKHGVSSVIGTYHIIEKLAIELDLTSEKLE